MAHQRANDQRTGNVVKCDAGRTEMINHPVVPDLWNAENIIGMHQRQFMIKYLFILWNSIP
jgi:hypothetical protein